MRSRETEEARVEPWRDASAVTFWKLFAGAVLAALALGVLANLKDIRRYIRITTM